MADHDSEGCSDTWFYWPPWRELVPTEPYLTWGRRDWDMLVVAAYECCSWGFWEEERWLRSSKRLRWMRFMESRTGRAFLEVGPAEGWLEEEPCADQNFS